MFGLCIELFKKNKTSQRRDAEAQRKSKEIKIVAETLFSAFVFSPRLCVSVVRGLVFILFIVNTLSEHSQYDAFICIMQPDSY